MTIRTATLEDLDAVTRLEELCFPPAEAASRASFEQRLKRYGGHFWLMLEGDTLVSLVDGPVTDAPDLTDEMFAHADTHNEAGAWQMIFGVCTLPEYRRRGCAGRLIERCAADARAQGRRGVVLTCKERLVPYYAKFGFADEGITDKSCHGGASWHQMRLTF